MQMRMQGQQLSFHYPRVHSRGRVHIVHQSKRASNLQWHGIAMDEEKKKE
jgi:hypothetical protein